MTQPTHQNALAPDSMLMEYRLTSVLGAGGFGITYLARDSNLEKDVAIKEYMPGSVAVRRADGTITPTNAGHEHDYRWGLERFIQEARTLAKFSHPHIVRVNRFFEANGSGYMVMDYEAGESLKAWIKRNPFPAEQALKTLLAPLLDGLEKVHEAGFLHRDIKPDNIFIRKDGAPVLIDFGSARQAIGGATQTLTTIVSPGYAPFEQYTTSSQQGPWSDIYALGGVLFFAVTGHNPPDAITRMKTDTLPQALGAARMRYSGPFIDAITWGLVHEEAARPRRVDEWRDALLGQLPTSVAAASTSVPTSTTLKTAPIGRSIPAVPAAHHQRTERVVRAPPQSGVTVIVARGEQRSVSPVKWATFAVVALGVVALGIRSMSSREPVSASVPPRVAATVSTGAPVKPVGEASAATNPDPVHAAVIEGTATTITEATTANQPSAPTATPAEPGTQLAQSKGAADQLVNDALRRVADRAPERRSDQRLPIESAGPGLTREEMARTYPQLAAHFDDIDADHDGRISPQELVDALQGVGGQRQLGLQ